MLIFFWLNPGGGTPPPPPPDATARGGMIANGATIAIGAYAKAAGMTLNESLRMQQAYAILTHTKWDEDEERSFWYYPLPKRNVENTEIGYNLAK